MTALEAELAALEAAGVDTQATLDKLITLLSEPAHAHGQLSDGLKRTYNQAWFRRIYIDVNSKGPTDPLTIVEERTPIAAVLDATRALVAQEATTKEAGPCGPAPSVIMRTA